MKKLLAILLSAMLLTCACACAEEAEVYHFFETSEDFDIEMPLPEGATLGDKVTSELVSGVTVQKEGLAPVFIAIAASDLYDNKSMNDLTDDEVEQLKAIAGEDFDAPELTVDVTPSGNKYIHICANADSDVDSIFTLYMGYFIQMTQWHEDFATITDEDYAFMQQLLYNINFLPTAK